MNSALKIQGRPQVASLKNEEVRRKEEQKNKHSVAMLACGALLSIAALYAVYKYNQPSSLTVNQPVPAPIDTKVDQTSPNPVGSLNDQNTGDTNTSFKDAASTAKDRFAEFHGKGGITPPSNLKKVNVDTLPDVDIEVLASQDPQTNDTQIAVNSNESNHRIANAFRSIIGSGPTGQVLLWGMGAGAFAFGIYSLNQLLDVSAAWSDGIYI